MLLLGVLGALLLLALIAGVAAGVLRFNDPPRVDEPAPPALKMMVLKGNVYCANCERAELAEGTMQSNVLSLDALDPIAQKGLLLHVGRKALENAGWQVEKDFVLCPTCRTS